MVFSCPLHKQGQPVGQEEVAAPASSRLGRAVQRPGVLGQPAPASRRHVSTWAGDGNQHFGLL